jgi:hypothetical protein
LIYFHLFILPSSNINTINTNTEALLADRKEAGLDVTAERKGRVFVPGREFGIESSLNAVHKSIKPWQTQNTWERHSQSFILE